MLDQEIMVGKRLPHDESIKDMINGAKKLIEQLIYDFVYRLASSAQDSEEADEISYYVKILSGDDKLWVYYKKYTKTDT